MKRAAFGTFIAAVCAFSPSAVLAAGPLDTEHLPAYLRDRGTGVPLSVFGAYIDKGEFMVYPFFEYYRNSDYEYSPGGLGATGSSDFRGKFTASEQLIFLGYGLTDRLAFEGEVAIIQAELETNSDDTSALPDEIEESGLGDVEAQLRWRWAHENQSRPEVFSYFETVVPTQDEGSLIGTTDWEFKLGTGIIRGFRWGTLTARAALEYGLSEETLEAGEFALEYLKRLSPEWRVFAAVEGTQDEVELLTEAQWHVRHNVFLKLNNGFGLTSKATDWAPELGIVFSFRPGL